MRVGIIGAGFTGLAAGYYLSKKGNSVTIFERDTEPGGLAVGYQEKGWNWTLEKHYHHWFTNDRAVFKLASEINHKVLIRRPKTSSFVDSGIFQLDSPLSLLKFPKINIFERIRMGASLAFLRYNPVWHPLERFRAEPYLKISMGQKGYEKLWEPLMINKLGEYSSVVSLAWFWGRVFKRTQSLAYPEGGFLNFAEHLQKIIEQQGGEFEYGTEVIELSSKNKPEIKFKKIENGKIESKEFDVTIVTLPSSLFKKIAPGLPTPYTKMADKLISIGALNLVLRLKTKFLTDDTYWLNMCEKKSPILAIVEQTNFMDKKNYNNEHIIYLGNYMKTEDPRFTMTAEQILKLYDPWLRKINKNYQSSIIDYKLFHAPFAQPIIPANYSKIIPPFETPLKNVYLANIQQVYPWDRGTNYAVELGNKIANLITR